MFLVNSRYRCLAATPNSSYREDNHRRGHTLSRSYGANLPNSLTRVLSSALVFSTHLPVSVCGTVTSCSTQPAAFLGSMGSMTSLPRKEDRHHPLALTPRFIPTGSTYRLIRTNPSVRSPTLLRPCSAPNWWYRNIDLFSIGFAFRLRLRCRLTLPG